MLVLAGCGSTRGGLTASSPTASASPSAAPAPCFASASGRGSVAQAQIVDVRVAKHEGYDRIVFEFSGRAGPAGVPEYSVALATHPIYRDPSGLPLAISGDPVLGITLRGGTRAPLEGGRSTYGGSTTLAPSFPVLRELKEGGDFEAIATWYAGLTSGACVSVTTLASPARLVIDLPSSLRVGARGRRHNPSVRTGRVLAVDVGGTKLAAGVVSSDGHVLAEAKTPTGAPTPGDAEALFARLERLCRDVLSDAAVAVDGIGVGCGGPMRFPEGVVSPLHIPAWRDFPLRDRLTSALGHACVVDNDAKAMALGEWWLGAGRGKRHLVGMVVSTGVGGGVIVDGRLLHGAHGQAGHVGHVNVMPDGPECTCGARGCAGAFASGSGIARRYRDARGETRTAAEIAELARGGDELASRLFREAGAALGRMIASVEAICDLEVAIVGGSIALHAWDLLERPLVDDLRATSRFAFTRHLPVVRAALGEQAGLLGAAALALGAE